MEPKDIEMAEYIINLKIAKSLKENKSKTYQEIQEEITTLKEEKNEIYKNNEEIINKILTQYLEDVKNK